jgi:hypothetical protein
LFTTILSFLDERQKKLKFLAAKDLVNFNKEKNQVLDFLPEGVIIYKKATEIKPLRIRYVNKTFVQMFKPNDESVNN